MGLPVNKKPLLSLLLSSMLLATFWSATPVHATPSWIVLTVDVNAYGYGNGYSPIVLDSNNIPHIAYTDAYTYYDGGAR